MARWNAVADGQTANATFHWDAFDQFPHPTYKGGTAEGYGAFAEVLAAFFERGDNSDFLARNELFKTPLFSTSSRRVRRGSVTASRAGHQPSPRTRRFGDDRPRARVRLQTIAARIRASLT